MLSISFSLNLRFVPCSWWCFTHRWTWEVPAPSASTGWVTGRVGVSSCGYRLLFPKGGLNIPMQGTENLYFFPKQLHCWGSQCFLSMFDLSGMLCPPGWACLRSCLPACLWSCLGACLGRCVRLGLSPILSSSWSGMLCPAKRKWYSRNFMCDFCTGLGSAVV